MMNQNAPEWNRTLCHKTNTSEHLFSNFQLRNLERTMQNTVNNDALYRRSTEKSWEPLDRLTKRIDCRRAKALSRALIVPATFGIGGQGRSPRTVDTTPAPEEEAEPRADAMIPQEERRPSAYRPRPYRDRSLRKRRAVGRHVHSACVKKTART